MGKDDPAIQELLIGYVLDSLDADERAAFETRLATDEELVRQVAGLRATLKPLDAWEADEPASSMVDDIMARIERTSPLEYVATSTTIAPEAETVPVRRSRLRLWDVLATAACLALIVSVVVPGLSRYRGQNQQNRCGVQMAGLGQGLAQYYNAFGALPSVGHPQNENWLRNPNRRHYGPAVRLNFVVPRDMICPSDAPGDLDDEAIAKNVQAFLRRVDIRFYSQQNMSGPVPSLQARVRMPLVADANPMFEGGRFDPSAAESENSRAHGGRGQNVLFVDGSVEFAETPLYGADGDNIWRARNVDRYSGTERQSSATDAFLVP